MALVNKFVFAYQMMYHSSPPTSAILPCYMEMAILHQQVMAHAQWRDVFSAQISQAGRSHPCAQQPPTVRKICHNYPRKNPARDNFLYL